MHSGHAKEVIPNLFVSLISTPTLAVKEVRLKRQEEKISLERTVLSVPAPCTEMTEKFIRVLRLENPRDWCSAPI